MFINGSISGKSSRSPELVVSNDGGGTLFTFSTISRADEPLYGDVQIISHTIFAPSV